MGRDGGFCDITPTYTEMSQITVNGCFSKVEEKAVLQWAKKFLLTILLHFVIIDPANIEISKNPRGNVLQSGIVSLYVNSS